MRGREGERESEGERERARGREGGREGERESEGESEREGGRERENSRPVVKAGTGKQAHTCYTQTAGHIWLTNSFKNQLQHLAGTNTQSSCR